MSLRRKAIPSHSQTGGWGDERFFRLLICPPVLFIDSLLLLSGESVRQREGNVQLDALRADNVAQMMKYHKVKKAVLYF
jgi:hypothetical protein